MPSYSVRRQRIREFKDVVNGANDSVATKCLEATGWNADEAVGYFYDNRWKFPEVKQGDTGKLGKLFAKYADKEEPSEMSESGTTQFFKDVNVNAEGYQTLVIAWHLKCDELGIITKDEFVNGFAKSGCSSIKDVKNAVTTAVNSVNQEANFKQFYKWLFIHTREDDKKKTIPAELALQLWKIVLKKNASKYKLLDDWLKFVENSNELKAISKDLWEQLIDFLTETQSVNDFDDNGAWPVAIDEFVEHLRES